jgi:hypothetical protein
MQIFDATYKSVGFVVVAYFLIILQIKPFVVKTQSKNIMFLTFPKSWMLVSSVVMLELVLLLQNLIHISIEILLRIPLSNKKPSLELRFSFFLYFLLEQGSMEKLASIQHDRCVSFSSSLNPVILCFTPPYPLRLLL